MTQSFDYLNRTRQWRRPATDRRSKIWRDPEIVALFKKINDAGPVPPR
jgi:hypothetical protein